MEFETVGDAIKRHKITMLIYGEPKIGKTSLIKTLRCPPERILYVAADPGQLSLQKNARMPQDFTGVKLFEPKEPSDMRKIREFLQSPEAKEKFDFVIIDGLDLVGERALRIFKDSERVKKEKANMQRAYGDMADAMIPWIEAIQLCDVSSIFITHVDEDAGSDIRYKPSFPGKQVGAQLPIIFDEIFAMRMAIINEDSGKLERALQCTRDGDPRYLAGDRSGKLQDFEPADLGGLLAKIFESEELKKE